MSPAPDPSSAQKPALDASSAGKHRSRVGKTPSPFFEFYWGDVYISKWVWAPSGFLVTSLRRI